MIKIFNIKCEHKSKRQFCKIFAKQFCNYRIIFHNNKNKIKCFNAEFSFNIL